MQMHCWINERGHAAKQFGLIVPWLVAVGAGMIGAGCQTGGAVSSDFDKDVEFLDQHTNVIVLGPDPDGPRVAVVPEYQGRVMTSTTGGADGLSHGWINYDAVASGEIQPHINVYGGEDRFWMGPEGGQYAIFFKEGDPFEFEYWQTPACIDTEAYRVVTQNVRRVTFRHTAHLVNYSGSDFDVQIDRTIRWLGKTQIWAALAIGDLNDVDMVAYESVNKITNTGDNAWTKEGGLLSIWILGMLRHSDTTTVVAPFSKGSEQSLGPIVNDEYFGKVPADRLKVSDGAVFFRADGKYRSKIGLSPRRARDIIGSYDPARNLLTIVQYTKPEGVTDYVNSMWALQDEPYAGDVVNSYNDGPVEPGKPPLGPFYELETSSPAAALAPGESLSHTHRTMHFRGGPQALEPIAQKLLGVSLGEITGAFGG